MAPPSWLAAVLAAILLVIAGYCATRLAAARWWQRSTDHGADVMHTVMGVAMAGMLVPRLNPLQARAWAVLFAAGAVWFGWQVLRDRRHRAATRAGARVPAGRPAPGGHHGAHVLSCAAMVCMLVAAPGAGTRIGAGPGTGAMPVLALFLAVAVAVSVVVSTDRLPALRPALIPVPRPARVRVAPTQVSRAAPVTTGVAAPAGAAPVSGPPGQGTAAGPGSAPAARPVLSPRLAASCQIAMGVATAYMLILTL